MTTKEKIELLQTAIKIQELIICVVIYRDMDSESLIIASKYSDNTDIYIHSIDIYNRCIVRLEERYNKIINNLNQ